MPRDRLPQRLPPVPMREVKRLPPSVLVKRRREVVVLVHDVRVVPRARRIVFVFKVILVRLRRPRRVVARDLPAEQRQLRQSLRACSPSRSRRVAARARRGVRASTASSDRRRVRAIDRDRSPRARAAPHRGARDRRTRAAMRGVRPARELALATTAADERRGDAGASTGALGAHRPRAARDRRAERFRARARRARRSRGGDDVARACSRRRRGASTAWCSRRIITRRDTLSFASAHAGKAPYDEVELAYGTQTLWPDHCVQGTWGCAFHDELVVPQRAMVVRKGHDRDVDSYSAFFENDRRSDTGLDAYLKERGRRGRVRRRISVRLLRQVHRVGRETIGIRRVRRAGLLRGRGDAGDDGGGRDRELADAGVVVLETLPA